MNVIPFKRPVKIEPVSLFGVPLFWQSGQRVMSNELPLGPISTYTFDYDGTALIVCERILI